MFFLRSTGGGMNSDAGSGGSGGDGNGNDVGIDGGSGDDGSAGAAKHLARHSSAKGGDGDTSYDDGGVDSSVSNGHVSSEEGTCKGAEAKLGELIELLAVDQRYVVVKDVNQKPFLYPMVRNLSSHSVAFHVREKWKNLNLDVSLVALSACGGARNLMRSSLDFNKKFYNSLGRAPNRCSSSIGKTLEVVIVHSRNRLGRLDHGSFEISFMLVTVINQKMESKDMVYSLQRLRVREKEMKEECNKNLRGCESYVKMLNPGTYEYTNERAFEVLFGEKFDSFKEVFVHNIDQLEKQVTKRNFMSVIPRHAW
uniref:Uncharacterized protein n=1 Tax=Tanacetum cinerariifolium TaxID=118510 RepID=A0A6L2KPZ2_TANCI|nr:hypothetical protein [Tanacetum cinerariifolium]